MEGSGWVWGKVVDVQSQIFDALLEINGIRKSLNFWSKLVDIIGQLTAWIQGDTGINRCS